MFSTEGGARSNRQNRLVAGYLAFVGGFVNSSGFVLVGTFTSHVTGNVGRLADDAALGNYSGALAALTMVFCFLGGAFAASVTVESHFFTRRARAYATALGFEAALLAPPRTLIPGCAMAKRCCCALRWGCRMPWSLGSRGQWCARRTSPAW
jgi:uncharacterized membrane protein YoaK (UPF0700 family)